MTPETTEELKKLIVENPEFRKELITNTKELCDKYGIDASKIKVQTSDELDALVASKNDGQLFSCIVPNGFLICTF
jgi:hypothetical protein